MAAVGPVPPPKQFVLCFDGTGNKFAGDGSDTNLLKIYRMLDRTKSHQYHYYQPGIGTYVSSHSLSSNGMLHRIKSAYLKAKDSAIGSSFDEHVLGGYKFLMRYYSPGDDIFLLGFSRGAYIARFLAEMLDFIGLLEAGNEEMIRFAWKTFAKWQQRHGDTEENRKEKKKLFNYMKAFRETFSRPVSEIRFMGLFDTVNSVPAFENAWMRRSRFPYTARSSAKIIRHAVSIDERRAKFRQDLISGIIPSSRMVPSMHRRKPHLRQGDAPEIVLNDAGTENGDGQADTMQQQGLNGTGSVYRTPHSSRPGSIQNEHTYRASPNLKTSLAVPGRMASTEDLASISSNHSGLSLQVPNLLLSDDNENEGVQDIKEVWFPGQHGDVGGGWKIDPHDSWPLSHVPLVWMVKEAQLAGLQFDPRKLKQFECYEGLSGVSSAVHDSWATRNDEKDHDQPKFDIPTNNRMHPSASGDRFHDALNHSITKGVVHDCLEFGGGLPPLSVLSWWIMEYLPFRRMDLQPDGSWKPINWPLPCGEVRDIPYDAEIHVSAIRRMQIDSTYRPGNLIIGGGGRGVKRAPEKYGMGEWIVCSNRGDPVRETYVRKSESKMCADDSHR